MTAKKKKTFPSRGLEIQLDSGELREALKAVGTATSTTEVAGSVVRIEGGEGESHLWLLCSSPRLSVEYKLPLTTPLSAYVNVTTSFPLLNSIARHVVGLLMLEVEQNKLVARGDSIRAGLPLFNDLPLYALLDPEEPLEPLFSAPYADADSWFKRATWAADERSERTTFVGPHILREAERGAVVASDTRVMVVYFVDGATLHSDDIQLPIHFLSAIGRMGIGTKEQVSFLTDLKSHKIAMNVGERLTVVSPLVYGTFPSLWKDYVYQLDKSIYTDFTVSKLEATEALQRALDLANAQQHAKNIYVTLKFGGGVCDVQVIGAANEVYTAFFYGHDHDGEDAGLTISLDPSLLIPFLKRCDSDAVLMSIPNVTENKKPIVISDGVYDTADYRCIIAPVRE